MGNFYNYMGDSGMGPFSGPGLGGLFGGLMFGSVMLVLVLWTLYWKFQALWYAAKHDHKWWFIAMMVINTVGILEILYLYVFSKKMDVPAGHDENIVPMVPPMQ